VVSRSGAGALAASAYVGTAAAGLALILVGGLAAATGTLSAAAADATAGGLGCSAGTGDDARMMGEPLTAAQLGVAATIVAVTAGRGLPPRAAVIAVATAYQESRLRNLPGGDADSVGVFQQRLIYYPATVAADPQRATAAFLERLVLVPGWADLPVTVAAQAVQRSAHPGAYAPWQALAEHLVAQHWPGALRLACGDADPAAEATLPGRCVSPLPEAAVTSRFGWRIHPITGARQVHAGVDLAGGVHGHLADPIRAACDGVVAFAGPASGYGTYLAIRHAGFVTGYGHMWTTSVRVGQRVRAGQVIAFVGCAGSCTGPHLHFEVRPTLWGPPADPVAFFAARGVVIP
jgi:murein DD-endopeptidase MepM/ murein hydrolase activator NlpD